MTVVEKKPIPIYEKKCFECKSVIRYKRSEVSLVGYITCPVCGVSLCATTLNPVAMEDSDGA